MALVTRPHPRALPHGAIREVLPGIHLVNGTVRMAMPPLRFSRNMTIVREGERIVLVNCVRLDEAGGGYGLERASSRASRRSTRSARSPT